MVLRGVCLAAIATGIAPWLARFYEQPVLEHAIAVMGLGLLCNGFQNINVVALQKELDFRRLTYMEQVGAVLTFVVTLSLAYSLRDVWALVYAQVAASAITSVLSFVMVPGRVRFRLDWQVAKELVGYGRFITGLAIVVFASRELDNAVIGKILGMDQLGFYVSAYTLANIPSTYLSKLVAKVMFPLFSKLQNDPERLRAEYDRGMRMLTMSVAPLAAVIAVLAPDIVRALYGERWMAAADPLRILAIFGGCRALWMLNGYLYNAIGKPHVDFVVNLVRLVVMAALLLPMTKAWGLVGASVAVTLPMLVQCVSGLFLTRRYIGASASLLARPMLEGVAHGIVLSVVLVAVKQVLGPNPQTNLLILAATAGIAYAALNARTLQTMVATRRV
jgi:O-antigen/teichoic acid export membrane protein